MVLFFIVFVLLIMICIGVGWLLYQQMLVKTPEFIRGGFYHLENHLLRIFTDLYEPDLGRKLNAQLKYFKNKGKHWRIENNAYHDVELYEEDQDLMQEQLLFPYGGDGKLARINFRIGEMDHVMILRCNSGVISGWDIRPNPGDQFNNAEIEIIETRILQHPEDLNPGSQPGKNSGKLIKYPFLEVLLQSPSLREVRSPKSLSRLHNRLRSSGTKLPESFLLFLKYADGMTFENGRIYGSRTLMKLMSEEEEFWPLAEFSGELIGVRPGDRSGAVYTMNKDLKKLRKLRGDFTEQLLARLDTFDIRS
ncbi:hypothetical protein D3A96_02290 [Robertkochia marina]|nr:hypothetical protein D3A96_02290 [Robertkochia marina]